MTTLLQLIHKRIQLDRQIAETFIYECAAHGPHEVLIKKAADEYGWLGNMSPYPVTYTGAHTEKGIYRTTEHLFQALRFKKYPKIQKEIRDQLSPFGAKCKVRKKSVRVLLKRENWDEHPSDIPRMRVCLKLKLEQHPELEKMLLDTHDAEIIEDCSDRPGGSAKFWGAVKDKESGEWVGKNVLGTLWMELRDTLRSSSGRKGRNHPRQHPEN